MKRLTLLLGLVLACAIPASGSNPGVNGKIAFERQIIDAGIWVMNQDGSDQHKLADGRESAWSPDGTKIAYLTGPGNVADSGELGLMNADGSGQRLVDTDLGPNVADPDWSPEGSRIVLSAFGDVYSVPAYGGRSTLLARDGANPQWSPDGTRIAFLRDTTIMLMNADGSGLHALVDTGGGNTSSRRFSWSPDGSRIAFDNLQDAGIDVINAAGTGRAQLVPAGRGPGLPAAVGVRSTPAWSPDGTRIAFLENGDICTAALGGSGVARLTYTPVDPGGVAADPAWQPLPPGSKPAGVPGGSAGPPDTFPRSTYWYQGCDRPDDQVTISVHGPARARVGSRVTYTIVLKNEGTQAISPIEVGDYFVSRAKALRPLVATQGRCGGFEHYPPRTVAECELGTLFPEETASVRVLLRLKAAGTFVDTAIKDADNYGQQERSASARTKVVRR